MNSTTDWYTVEQLTENVSMIYEAVATTRSNVFVIDAGERSLVVDTGKGVGDLRRLIDDQFAPPEKLVLTHWHWDHIGNAHQFDDVVIHPLECTEDGRVTIDVLSDEFVQRPSQFVAQQREAGTSFPDSFDPDTFSVPPTSGVGTVEEGDEIEIGQKTLEVVEIPGHSPGQIAVLDREAGILYGADIVHVRRGLFAHFRDSSLEAYRESLEKLIDLRDAGAFETLLTAHNDPISGADLSILNELLTGVDSILNDELDFERIETNWGDARQYFVGDSKVLTKPRLS